MRPDNRESMAAETSSMNNVGDRHRIWLAVALGFLAVACLAVSSFTLYLSIVSPILNTEYAPGYSGRAFRAVAVGDSEERVLHLLGDPLERNPNAQDPSYVYLRYSRAIGPSDSHLGRVILLRDGQVARIWDEIYLD
jgi:hypothetical protein